MPNERVSILGDTEQLFNGKIYSLSGKYFARGGKRLHRVVWEFHNGPIAKGLEIHHRDDNRANNQIENLELLPASLHRSMHAQRPESKAKARINIAKGQENARKWHGSPAGHQWHKEQAQRIQQAMRERRARGA